MNFKTFYAIFFISLSLNASSSIQDIKEELKFQNYRIGQHIKHEELLQRIDEIISTEINYDKPIRTVILPKDIIILISSLLTMHDHLKMTKVCKSWHQALNDLKNYHLHAIWKNYYDCEFEFMIMRNLRNTLENCRDNRAEFKNFSDKYKRRFKGELDCKIQIHDLSFDIYKRVIKFEFLTTEQICNIYLNDKHIEKIKSTRTATGFLNNLRRKITSIF